MIPYFATAQFASQETGVLLQWLLGLMNQNVGAETFIVLHLLIRKLAHLAVYGILGILTFRAVRGDRAGRTAVWITIAIAYSLALAALDEFLQRLTPTRTGAVMDVVIDFMGAVIGVFFFSKTRPALRQDSGKGTR